MNNMKNKFGDVGKKIDESISDVAASVKEKTKEITKSIAKKAVRKTGEGATKVAISIGKGIEGKAQEYTKKVKDSMGLKEGMTPGQKAGVVVERTVDMLVRGLDLISKKLEEKQAVKFASPNELKIKGFDALIGEGIKKAITIERASKCRIFVETLQSNRKLLPHQLKDMREEILNDTIKGGCTSLKSLLNYLMVKEGVKTKAEIDYLNREIKIIEQKIKEEENGTGNEDKV